jgi:hypothetical protein
MSAAPGGLIGRAMACEQCVGWANSRLSRLNLRRSFVHTLAATTMARRARYIACVAAALSKFTKSPKTQRSTKDCSRFLRAPCVLDVDYDTIQTYCSPWETLLPHSALLPQSALDPHSALLPQSALDPHNALLPHKALLPEGELPPVAPLALAVVPVRN